MTRCVFAQTDFPRQGLSIQSGFQGGASFSTDKIPAYRQYGFVLEINQQTSGEKYWQADHRYPQMGLQISARGFPGTSGPGSVFVLIPYLEFNVAESKVGQWQIKHGTGLAYVTGDFERMQKVPLGSKLNASSILDIGYQFKTRARFAGKVGIVASHISNGNLVRPNAGLNSWLGYGQLVYFPFGELPTRIPYKLATDFRRWRYRFYLADGLYDYKKSENQIQQNIQAGLLVFYQHSTRFRTGAGLELGRVGKGEKTQLAGYLEEEVLFAHLVTRYGFGVYLTPPIADESRTYAKVGIAWYPCELQKQIANGFSIGATIKAHGFRAAHVELAAGYTF
ncbi:acyloxyacyl hydrolase [Salmonirosea aquatica]